MYIDFTKNIKEMKEKDVLHKPFPTGSGYALFAKNENDNFVKVLFSSQDHLKKYLADLGYEWGDEGKDEFTNFDCELRLLKVLPELSEVETMAADPQWKISEKAVDLPQNSSVRKMEDLAPELQEELREVDHPLHWDEGNYDAKAKKPDFLKKKGDKKNGKKDDKKDGKKNGEKGDEEKDKNGKKLPPWLNKKKSKSKDYSKLYKKVTTSAHGLAVGDMVEDINPDCKHFGSRGNIVAMKKIAGMHTKNASADDNGKHTEEKQDAGYLFAYSTINAGVHWDEGDVLEKTGDQLRVIEGNVSMPWVY